MKLTRTLTLELGRKADGARTFGAVLSTDGPVKRRDYDGEFFEVLSHKSSAIDLSRAPLPLIESHDQRTLPIGIVDNIRVVDGKLRGDVTFGASQRAQEVAADVEAGIIRNLSVGYTIEKTVEKNDGKKRTITATRWTPHEVSAVAIGADVGAGFGRSAMGDEIENQDTPNPTTEQQTNNGTREAAALERERCAEIHSLARRSGEDPAFTESLIRDGVSLPEARKQLVFRAANRDGGLPINGHGGVEGDFEGGFAAVRGHREPSAGFLGRSSLVTAGIDAAPDFRSAAVDALLLRSGVQLAKPHPAARDISASVIDLARTCISRTGHRAPQGKEELLRRAMTTSDFPLILADAMHKATMRGYETEPASHRSWVRALPVPDLREQKRVILGSAPELLQVNEGGEYQNGALDEDGTSYQIAKYGRIVTLTWETLRNDNIGAFLRVQPAMGQAARRLEADIVYALFALNAGAGPTMQDTKALFHVDHGNLGVAAAFDSDALGAARTMLRKQTALGGGYMSLVPRFIIVAAELEQEAEVIIAQAARAVTTVDAVTPQWIANLDIVVEPRLDDGAFYLAADSSQVDHCELGLLEENFNGPQITEDRSGEFRNDQYSWKVKHVVGAKFLDWRGIVKQPIS